MAVIKINEKYYDVGEEFADKQVVDDLIKDFNITIAKVNTIIKTQNNIIDNLSAYEKVITNKIIDLKIEIDKIKINKDRTEFATEFFVNLHKIEKNTKINNSNINLLEMRIDNIDKFIQNFLTKKYEEKMINSKLSKNIKVERTNNFLLDDKFNKLNSELVRIKLRVDLTDKFIQNFLTKKYEEKMKDMGFIQIKRKVTTSIFPKKENEKIHKFFKGQVDTSVKEIKLRLKNENNNK